jgi:hypothetical protein
MSAPVAEWSTRLSEVGACGIESRRIFATLQSDGRAQSSLIQQAVNAGMMPVVSYKVPSVATLIAGGYDSWLTNTRNYLNSLGVQVTATFWHEPHGDMTAADFRAGSQRFLTRVKAANVAVGPILNGWLLDNQVSTFASYTNATLLAGWDFVAVDSYQAGTASAPDASKPGGRALPLLETWLDGQGYPNKPIGMGEYNGWTAASIDYGGDQVRTIPEVWFGLLWNETTGQGAVLTGSRLTEFKEDKAAPEVKHDPGC